MATNNKWTVEQRQIHNLQRYIRKAKKNLDRWQKMIEEYKALLNQNKPLEVKKTTKLSRIKRRKEQNAADANKERNY